MSRVKSSGNGKSKQSRWFVRPAAPSQQQQQQHQQCWMSCLATAQTCSSIESIHHGRGWCRRTRDRGRCPMRNRWKSMGWIVLRREEEEDTGQGGAVDERACYLTWCTYKLYRSVYRHTTSQPDSDSTAPEEERAISVSRVVERKNGLELPAPAPRQPTPTHLPPSPPVQLDGHQRN